MRGKSVTSGERAIILNVFKHLKGNFPLESQRSVIERTSKATGSKYLDDQEDNQRGKTSISWKEKAQQEEIH